MTSSTSTPQQTRPLPEVRPVQLWRSIDGESRGWFPGIFGITDRFRHYGYLIPAYTGPSPIDNTNVVLAPTPEACMAEWETREPAQLTTAQGLGLTFIEQINALKLYRDPNKSTVQNPWEEHKEMESVSHE